jgi:hypothetical protein
MFSRFDDSGRTLLHLLLAAKAKANADGNRGPDRQSQIVSNESVFSSSEIGSSQMRHEFFFQLLSCTSGHT